MWLFRRRRDLSETPLQRRLRNLSLLERLEEAKHFLLLFHSEGMRGDRAFRRRWSEARRHLLQFGFYEHSPEELAFGARVAWRNHGRCIGRLAWESLEVFDCRDRSDPDDVTDQMASHMRMSFGDGRIKPMISIFAPVRPGPGTTYIESEQVIQYAGHSLANGRVVGDRQNVEATRMAMSLGYSPPSLDDFQVLPLIIRDASGKIVVRPLPRNCVPEVEIRHPTNAAFDALGLRWYALPCVSGMILTIGGIDYPCAPFSGYYMGTEIASRDLVDVTRFDRLADIGNALGLDTSKDKSLWKDVALTELNIAVLHSFRQTGVTIVDHHTASRQFIEFRSREQVCGRHVAADWRWIVPPAASAACDVFHIKMRDFHPAPNFYRSRGDDGLRLMPFYGDRDRSRALKAYDGWKRRWKLWKRRRER